MPGGQIMQGSYFILFSVFLKIYDPPHLETGRLGEGLSEASGAETGSALSAPFHFGSEATLPTLGTVCPAVLRTALTWPMELFSVSREAAFLFEWIFFAWGWTIQGEARLLRD